MSCLAVCRCSNTCTSCALSGGCVTQVTNGTTSVSVDLDVTHGHSPHVSSSCVYAIHCCSHTDSHNRGISPTGALMMLSDPAYWRAICPQLHVCDPTFVERSTTTTVQPSDETIRGCRRRMNRDGYFDLPPAQVKMDIDLNALVLGITQLTELGWPPNFILMYDEAWFMVHQLEELIFQTTGNRLICDFSAFHVSSVDWLPMCTSNVLLTCVHALAALLTRLHATM